MGVISERRSAEVRDLLAEGLTIKQIAESMGVKPDTVRAYASFRRAGVKRIQMVASNQVMRGVRYRDVPARALNAEAALRGWKDKPSRSTSGGYARASGLVF